MLAGRNKEVEIRKAAAAGENAVLDNVDTLPQGWKAVLDADTGETYYWNKDTGVTQWERPY